MFNQDYYIKGKHAEYMKILVSSSEGVSLGKSAKIFDYGYQVLFIAPLIGVAYELKPKLDESNTMDFTIKAIQMIKNNIKIKNVYQMVLLADRSINLSPDGRVDFNFRPNEKQKEQGYELFDSYLRGGIEWLYNNIVREGNNDDEYLNNIISAIGGFTTEFGIYEDLEETIKETEEKYF